MTVTHATVRADFLKTLDVEGYFTAKVTFNLDLVNFCTDLFFLIRR